MSGVELKEQWCLFKVVVVCIIFLPICGVMLTQHKGHLVFSHGLNNLHEHAVVNLMKRFCFYVWLSLCLTWACCYLNLLFLTAVFGRSRWR